MDPLKSLGKVNFLRRLTAYMPDDFQRRALQGEKKRAGKKLANANPGAYLRAVTNSDRFRRAAPPRWRATASSKRSRDGLRRPAEGAAVESIVVGLGTPSEDFAD